MDETPDQAVEAEEVEADQAEATEAIDTPSREEVKAE